MKHTLTRLVIAVMFLTLPTMALAQRAPVLDPARTVVIQGAIGRGNVLQLIAPMLKMVSDNPRKPIDMIISSPGGEMLTGFMFLNGMEQVKAEGGRIRCYVPTMAASMAFQILLHCDERYTLDKSFLLWHGVRVSGLGVVTEETAADLTHDLHVDNETIVKELLGTLGKYMSEKDIMYHFHKETLHEGYNLARLAPGFIVSYPSIKGLMTAMMTAPVQAPQIKMQTEFDEIFIQTQKAAGVQPYDPLKDQQAQKKVEEICKASLPGANTTVFETCKHEINVCIIELHKAIAGGSPVGVEIPRLAQCTVKVLKSLGGKTNV